MDVDKKQPRFVLLARVGAVSTLATQPVHLQFAYHRTVELVCHPGFEDPTLVGRDCFDGDGLMQWRVDEMALLDRPEFLDAVAGAGFRIASPTEWLQSEQAHGHAA